MSDNNFDDVFGRPQAPRPSFTDRLKGQAPPPQEPKPEPVADDFESGFYKPYGFLPAGNIGEVCDVRRWIDKTDIAEGIEFQYRFLMQVGYVGEEQLRLFLPDCIVVIEGKHLLDLRKKLARRMVTFMQQHNPRVWPVPPTDEPVIERIEIMRPEMFRLKT